MNDRVWMLLGEPGQGEGQPAPDDCAWATVFSTRERAEAYFADNYYPKGIGDPEWVQPGENPDMAEIEFINSAGYDERFVLYLIIVDDPDA